MDDVEIPHYLDSQPQVFFWELDEFAVWVFFLGLGVATDTLTAWFPLLFAFSYLFNRFKAGQMEGILAHMVYWSGVLSLNQKFRNGLARELVS